jgi:poly(beta-D-mannuronate) lyase
MNSARSACRTPLLLLGLGLLVGWTAPAHAFDVSSYRVTKPGSVLVDTHVRRTQLGRYPAETANLFCPAPANGALPAPVLRLGAKDQEGPDTAAEPFSLFVMQAAGRALIAQDAQAGAIAALENWAGANALSEIVEFGKESSNTNAVYSLKRAATALVLGWPSLREAASDEARKSIESWLGRLVERADVPTGEAKGRGKPIDCLGASEPHSECNNHRYLRDALNMAWGALVQDDARYRKGVARYLIALQQMRENGSFPLETVRGARAIWYQRHAIASLVLMAEIAANQGHDLYALNHEGRSIHTAVHFLLEAIEDPAIVLADAARNVRPGAETDYRKQDLGFLTKRGARHTMAWMEPYMLRFPGHQNSRQLAVLAARDRAKWRPMIDEFSGGNLTCLFAEP